MKYCSVAAVLASVLAIGACQTTTAPTTTAATAAPTPGDEDFVAALVFLALGNGNDDAAHLTPQARQLLEQTRTSAATPLARCLRAANNAEDTRTTCALPVLQPASIDAAQALAALRHTDVRRAREHLDAALKAAPGHAAAHAISLDPALSDSPALQQAHAEALVKAMPQCGACQVRRAMALERGGAPPAAVAEAWQQARRLRQGDSVVAERTAAALLRVGTEQDKATALSLYRDAQNSGHAQALTWLAVAALEHGNDTSAHDADLETLRKGHAAHPTHVPLSHALMLALLADDDANIADRARLDEAMAIAVGVLNADDDDGLSHLAFTLGAMGAQDWQTAAKHAHRAHVDDSAMFSDPVIKSRSERLSRLFAAKRDYFHLEVGLIEPTPTGPMPTIVKAITARARKVYRTRLKSVPTLRGGFNVAADINGNGQVVNVTIESDTLNDNAVVACVVGNLYRAKVVVPSATRYRFTLTFE